MSSSYYDWDTAWTAMTISAAAWTGTALADADGAAIGAGTGSVIGDAVSLDGCVAMEISIGAEEDAAGAIDDNVTICVLSDIDGTIYEGMDQSAFSFQFLPETSDIYYKRFVLSASSFSSVKIAIFNDSGQSLKFTVKYRKAVITSA